jgi:hypothetical protein
MKVTRLRFVPVLLLVGAFGAGAQPAAVIDEGTFTLTRASAPLGSETFKIFRRQGADGAEYVAQCTHTIEGSVVRTALTVDSSGTATSYSRATTGSPGSQLTARRALGRLTVEETGSRSSTEDFLFAPGSLILDDDLVHQLYFVTWRGDRPIKYVAPGTRGVAEAALSEVGDETISLGNESVSATHFAFGSGDARRDIWIDSNRRLLKVSIPSRQIEAIRDRRPH